MNGIHGKGKAPARPPGPQPPPLPSAKPQAHLAACSCAQPIPRHPNSDYHRRIFPHSTVYYCWDKTWQEYKVADDGGRSVRLVEVWDTARRGRFEIWAHPSRNRFRWLGNAPLTDKTEWHEWVRGKAADLIAANLPVGMPKPKAPDKKAPDVPNWATPANLIGYTWNAGISARDLAQKRVNPSVYYLNGHFTADHPRKDNIGWERGLQNCLFFGNVFLEYIEYPP